MRQLAIGIPFEAIDAAFERGAPLMVRDVLKFEPAAVRALFDEGLIEQETRRNGRATFTVIVPTPLARMRNGESARKAADPWTPKAIAYLKEAYPSGASFREMAAETGISGGRILIKAQALRLCRPCFAPPKPCRPKLRSRQRRDNWMTTPAWRVRRLRVALKDAQARGTNPFDAGEGLNHRALWRRFELGRRAPRLVAGLNRWTPAENRVLREHYARGGTRACLALLPRRTAAAISHQATHVLKLKAPRGGRYLATPEVDAAIRRVYRGRIGKGQVADLARRLGYPGWWVKKRAVVLGLVRPRRKEPNWKAAELRIVDKRAHQDLRVIQDHLRRAGYRRSTTGIKIQIVRRGFETGDPHYLTASVLARICGGDIKTVTGWIGKGLLKARRRRTRRLARQGGDHWWIHKRDFRRFVYANAHLVDLRNVEPVLFLELLAGKVPGRRVLKSLPSGRRKGWRPRAVAAAREARRLAA